MHVCVCLTSRIPSASITTIQVPGFRTNGSTKLFWGTLTKVGSTLGAKTICLDCSEPRKDAPEMLDIKTENTVDSFEQIKKHKLHKLTLKQLKMF